MAMKTACFRHWAFLNDAGKKLYGEVFPDGMVPVVNMIPGFADVGDHTERVYLIDYEELSEDQTAKMLQLLSQNFGVSEDAVRSELLKNRIPLREKYTRGSGTNQLGLFI